MTRRCVLLRVGIDSGCGGIQGPLFKDGSFDFVCIPDNKGVSVHTYGNMVGRDGRPHADYFAESRRKVMAKQHVHVDPEWETFTYGDPTPPKRSLRTLKPGDLLVFYCGLQEWDADGGWNRDHRPALYLAGYFEVALAGMAGDFEQKVLKSRVREELPRSLSRRLQAAEGRLGAGQGRSRQPVVPQAHQISSEERTGQEAAQGAVAQDAEGVRRLRRARLDPDEARPAGSSLASWRRRSGL